MTHKFSSPLSRDLFALGVSMQQQLAAAYEGVPRFEPTPEELNRMETEYVERKSEGRTLRPFRQNPHD